MARRTPPVAETAISLVLGLLVAVAIVLMIFDFWFGRQG
jgi:hypothetical protein